MRETSSKSTNGKAVNGHKEPHRNSPQDGRIAGFFSDGSVPEEPDYAELAAGRIWDIATAQKCLDPKSSRNKWAASIREFIGKHVDWRDFEIELSWYERHYSDDYVPQAYSANTFCRKLVDIRLARLREARRNGELTEADHQEIIRENGGFDPTAMKPMQFISREEMSPGTREWGDFSGEYPGHDLSEVQFRRLRQRHPEMSFKDLDEFCIKMTPGELWAYADGLPDIGS